MISANAKAMANGLFGLRSMIQTRIWTIIVRAVFRYHNAGYLLLLKTVKKKPVRLANAAVSKLSRT
jgi:hypothetical protein